jgi:hypothetical protein
MLNLLNTGSHTRQSPERLFTDRVRVRANGEEEQAAQILSHHIFWDC